MGKVNNGRIGRVTWALARLVLTLALAPLWAYAQTVAPPSAGRTRPGAEMSRPPAPAVRQESQQASPAPGGPTKVVRLLKFKPSAAGLRLDDS